MGGSSAVVELVEYGDYQCPSCGMAYPVVKNIVEQFGDNLRFVFRNFPLSESHPFAFAAAVATEAADKQQHFWRMHDAIFEHQRELGDDLLPKLAASIGLDVEQFEEDMNDHTLSSKVSADFESGVRSGVNGTPTFFVNGERFDGDYGELVTLIEELSAE